jgi:hypothetical protein
MGEVACGCVAVPQVPNVTVSRLHSVSLTRINVKMPQSAARGSPPQLRLHWYQELAWTKCSLGGFGDELDVLGALDGAKALGLALLVRALNAQHDLLGGLGLLVENGLRLSTESRLLSVVTTLT